MKILYLTPNFSNFFAATYDGMITSIAPYCDLTLYGRGYQLYDDLGFTHNILKVIEYTGDPDVIIMWDKEGSGWAGDFTNLDKVGCLKVLWSVDIQNDAVPKTLEYARYAGIGLILMTYDREQVSEASRIFKTLSTPIEYYPFSVDPVMFGPKNLTKKYDVSLLGNMSTSYYPTRNAFHEVLKDSALRYHHPHMETYVREEFARHINESRICVTGSSSWKFLVQKYYEITSCMVPLIADMCMDAEYQGFRPGETFIEASPQNILDVVNHYLTHEDEARRIAENGRHNILARHTHDIRARELMEVLKRYV